GSHPSLNPPGTFGTRRTPRAGIDREIDRGPAGRSDRGRCRGMIKDKGEVGATCTMAVSRVDPGLSRVRRRAGDITAPTMVPIRREEETSVVSHRTGRVESLR